MHYYYLRTAYILGGIRMLRNEEKQWELQVDHSLFAIKKLDITVSIHAEFSIITGASCVHGGGGQIQELVDLTRSWPLQGGRERVDLYTTGNKINFMTANPIYALFTIPPTNYNWGNS